MSRWPIKIPECNDCPCPATCSVFKCRAVVGAEAADAAVDRILTGRASGAQVRSRRRRELSATARDQLNTYGVVDLT